MRASSVIVTAPPTSPQRAVEDLGEQLHETDDREPGIHLGIVQSARMLARLGSRALLDHHAAERSRVWAVWSRLASR
jgi:hypothetical protein